jgi:hypothetical protein
VEESKTPIAVIAFAGAVTMIPGLSLCRALSGALKLAAAAGDDRPKDPGRNAPLSDAGVCSNEMRGSLGDGSFRTVQRRDRAVPNERSGKVVA